MESNSIELVGAIAHKSSKKGVVKMLEEYTRIILTFDLR